jgi:hypothetical protein
MKLALGHFEAARLSVQFLACSNNAPAPDPIFGDAPQLITLAFPGFGGLAGMTTAGRAQSCRIYLMSTLRCSTSEHPP